MEWRSGTAERDGEGEARGWLSGMATGNGETDCSRRIELSLNRRD
jgi:hypothetical protein